MRRGALAIIAFTLATLSTAAQASVFSTAFQGIITSGMLVLSYPDGAPSDVTTNIVGRPVTISLRASDDIQTGPSNFEVSIPGITPPIAGIINGAGIGGTSDGLIEITPTSLHVMVTALGRDNAGGGVEIFADRVNGRLVRLHGHFSGVGQPWVPNGLQMFQYRNVTFYVPDVPEPGTWALMIAGFAMAGAAVRRRNLQVFPGRETA